MAVINEILIGLRKVNFVKNGSPEVRILSK